MTLSRPRLLLANDTAMLGHHGSALVIRRLRALAEEAGLDLVVGWGWPRIEREDFRAGGWDGVIVNGEGSIHDDSATAGRVARLGLALRAADVPGWLVNTSERDDGAAVMRGLAAFRRVWARDRASARSLAAGGIAAEVAPDLTLSWRDAPQASGRGTALFVTDASEKGKSRRLLAVARRAGARFVSLRAEPPRAADGWPNPRRRGLTLKRLVARGLPLSPWSARHAPAFRDVDALASAFARDARGVICGRYHALCLALRTGTPFLAVSGNTSKMGDLLDDAGLGDRLTTLDALEASPADPPPFTEAERAAIAALLARAEAGAAAMIDAIATDLRR
jgi:hypothetical protein